jgi:hypothetical protein
MIDEDHTTPEILNTTAVIEAMTQEQVEHLHLQVSNVLGMHEVSSDHVRSVITFGAQYTRDPERGELHPQGMSKDGYFLIDAPDATTARRLAFLLFGDRWSFDYPAAEFFKEEADVEQWYPEGVLGRATFTVEGIQTAHTGIDIPPEV